MSNEHISEYGFMQSLIGCELRHQPNGELHIIPPEGARIGTNISSLILAAPVMLSVLKQINSVVRAAVEDRQSGKEPNISGLLSIIEDYALQGITKAAS